MSSTSEGSSTRSASPTPSNVRKRSHDEMNNKNDENKTRTDEKPTNNQGPSTQNLPPSQTSPIETKEPPSGQHHAEDSQDRPKNDSEEAEDPSILDPAEGISHLNWEDLEQRYHDMIRECENTESNLLEEWNSLIKVIYSHQTTLSYRNILTHSPSSSKSGPNPDTPTKPTEPTSGMSNSFPTTPTPTSSS